MLTVYDLNPVRDCRSASCEVWPGDFHTCEQITCRCLLYIRRAPRFDPRSFTSCPPLRALCLGLGKGLDNKRGLISWLSSNGRQSAI